MQIDGSCHCGLISFTAEVDPSRVVVCHCSDCQVLSGSSFRIIVPAPIRSFVLLTRVVCNRLKTPVSAIL